MYIYEHTLDIAEFPLHTSKTLDFYLDDFSNKKIGIIDIETTGLSPSKAHFILGGLVIFDRGSVYVKQFMAEDISEERAILKLYMDAISALDIIVSYNGQHFDINFIKERALWIFKKPDFKLPFHLDLYLFINGFSSLRKILPNLKQKTVENYMGFRDKRKDEISGGDSVKLYSQYTYSKDPSLRELILLHNRDDILQLSRLIKVFEKIDCEKAFFHMGFPVGKLDIHKITVDAGKLVFSGVQHLRLNYRSFEILGMPCRILFDGDSRTFEISLPLIYKNPFSVLDLRKFPPEFSAFSAYNTFDSGFLLVMKSNRINYRETVHFVKLLTDYILKELLL